MTATFRYLKSFAWIKLHRSVFWPGELTDKVARELEVPAQAELASSRLDSRAKASRASS